MKQKLTRSQHILFMTTLLAISLFVYGKANSKHFKPQIEELEEELKTQKHLAGILANQKMPKLLDLDSLKLEIANLEQSLVEPQNSVKSKKNENKNSKRLISTVTEKNKVLAKIYRLSYGLIELKDNKISLAKKIKHGRKQIQTYKHSFLATGNFHAFYRFFKEVNKLPWLIQTEKIELRQTDNTVQPSILWELTI